MLLHVLGGQDPNNPDPSAQLDLIFFGLQGRENVILYRYYTILTYKSEVILEGEKPILWLNKYGML